MTHIRKLALALCLALLCSSYSNSQTTSSQPIDGTTGSLTNFTGRPTDTTSVWNNAGSVGAPLTCWAGGDPGYCGPNPRVSAWGAGSNVINFSYGTVDLNQVVNINKALAIGGSGVQLSGFNFGFQAKNGNGWDDGRQDYLGAYVNLYNSGGGLAAHYDYTSQTNRRYGWTNFNFSETFSSPVPATNFSNAQYGFVGRDNNYWVGPYGPEIMNVNFSLKYTVKPDPCISDPLSSPTCPGYALATVKNSILGSTVSNASATSFVPTMNYTQPAPMSAAPGIADAAPALAQASPQQQAQQPPPQQQGPQPPPPGQDSNQNPGAGQDNPAQPSPQQAGPAPTQPQPAGGPPQTAQSAPPPSAGPSQAGPQQAGPVASGGGGPSKLAMSVVKSAQAKEQAVQQMAVQNAAKAFEGTQQSSQAASNSAISMNQDMSANSATSAAQFSSQSTQTSMQTSVQANQGPQQNTQSTAQQQQINKGVQQLQQATSTGQQDTQQQYTGTGLTVGKNTFNSYSPFNSINSNSMPVAPVQTAPVYQPKLEVRQIEVETPPMQIASFGSMGKAGNPLSDLMNQRMDMLQTNIEQRVDTVKKNVQPNELAGGVDVAAMAQIPKGYEAYSLVVLRDVPFYKPETIYKDQRTVDNARVFRGLTGGSDAKHQQMVDSQYKLGE
jgi:hypothetical protein